MTDILLLAFAFMVAGVIAVPIASRLGLGSVLGYLLAGIALSPLLARFGVDVLSIQHFAEFGVVMMLFLVGLELEPRLLWQMRSRLLGLGGLQVLVTAAAVAAVAMAFGLRWSVGIAIGFIVSLSSTAIVLQTLNEKRLLKSEGGQASFSVLLFQDIAVIPMLALIPLLALPDLAGTAHADGAGHGPAYIGSLPGWLRALVTAGAVAAVVVGGSVATRPIFRFIAMARLPELFTAVALMIVVGIALLMSLVGLSPALGTFLAGVVLANSEYRHQLESDIAPFKGLLLGLFFMTVGAAIDFELLMANVAGTFALTLGLMTLKVLVLAALAAVFGIRGADRWLLMLGLAQAGEFGFVLLSFTVANGVLPADLADRLLLVVALSMLLTPLLFIAYDRLIAPHYSGGSSREPDAIDDAGPIIIAGHGRFGGIINRMLVSSGHKTVVLDHHSEQLERLRRFGIKVYYGDASRPDLLHAAGIEHAKLLIIAIDDRQRSVELARFMAHNHPHVHVIARAVDRHHVYELWGAGCRDIIREHFDSAVRAGRSALEALGYHPYDAETQARVFVESDKRFIRDVADLYRADIPAHENEPYVAKVREVIARQEAEMAGSSRGFASRAERGWMPPTDADVATVAAENEALQRG